MPGPEWKHFGPVFSALSSSGKSGMTKERLVQKMNWVGKSWMACIL